MGDLRSALPWLAGHTVLAANQAAVDLLREELRRLGYSVRELEGERIVSDESFFDAMRRTFGLVGGNGMDWATLVEGIVAGREQLDEHVAILWHRSDASGFFSLRTVVEGAGALMAARARLEPDVRLELILLGQTRDFPQPERR